MLYEVITNISFDATKGEATIYARADILDVVGDEIASLITYKYWCNEQIASKLKARLAEKRIAAFKGVDYKHDKDIEKLIRLIKKNQGSNGLWGWWKESWYSPWISLHVLEALADAETMGFSTGISYNFV